MVNQYIILKEKMKLPDVLYDSKKDKYTKKENQ